MTDDSDDDCDLNCSETTEVSIGDVGAEKWHDVCEELVECDQTSRSSLTHTESTRLTTETGTGRGSFRQRLLNKVGD